MKLQAKEQEIVSDSRHADRATGYRKTISYKTLDGNEGVARIAYALNEVIGIYPITVPPHGRRLLRAHG